MALLAVLLCHGVPTDSLFAFVRHFGPQGVRICFGLSGFLIGSLLLREQQTKGGIDLVGFYFRRAFRILPPLYLMLGVIVTLGAIGILAPMPRAEWWADTLFLQSYVGKFPGRTEYTVHLWSLAVEQHFYLLFPVLLGALGRRRFFWLLVTLLAVAPLWREVDDHFVHLGQFFPGIFPRYRTDRCFDFLLWGVALAYALQSARARDLLTRFLSTPMLCLIALLFAVLGWKQPPHTLALEGIGVALMLAGTVLRPTAWPARLLELAPLRLLGRISYGFYLWQQLFFVSSFRAPAWPQSFPVNFLMCLGLATGSHLLIEVRLVELGKRLLTARQRLEVRPALLGISRASPSVR